MSELETAQAAHQGGSIRHPASSGVLALGQLAVIQPVNSSLSALRPAPKSDMHSLVENHLPLVGVLVAERLRDVPIHVRRDELMSAGLIALVLSAGAYDPGRGVPFRIFATYRIRGALIDELRSIDWVTRSVRCRGRAAETIRERLTAALERPPGIGDIAAALGISISELQSLYSELARGAVVSLQGIAVDMLPSDRSNNTDCPESLILRREQLGYLHDAVAALPERLRTVVVAYYFGHRQMSEIAIELDITQSRVSQMCAEATALIRDGMNSQLDPDALRPMSDTGRAAASRRAYYQSLADSNTVTGRLDMSTPQGEMHRGIYAELIEIPQRVRAAAAHALSNG